MERMIGKVIPILLLMALGWIFQKKKMFSESALDEIKKFIINIALPAVLFLTFVKMDFKREYFIVILITFLLLFVLMIAGKCINAYKRFYHPLNPFLTTGFTFGLLGVPLYATVYGTENLAKIAVLGVGHELFMWFVFFTVLKMSFKNEKLSFSVFINFLKSPLIISIILGITLNISGWYINYKEQFIVDGILTTLQYLANIATPMILIFIGFGLKLNPKYTRWSIRILIIRNIIIFTIAYTVKKLLIDSYIVNDPLFDRAFFTFLILPPPLSLPIFVGEYSTKEHKELVNNTVVLGTIISIMVFIASTLVRI